MGPLHVACLAGQTKVVELLLANKADVNLKTMVFCSLCSLFSISTFFSHLSLPFFFEKKEDTPLHAAVQGGHLNIVRLLLSEKADPIAQNMVC